MIDPEPAAVAAAETDAAPEEVDALPVLASQAGAAIEDPRGASAPVRPMQATAQVAAVAATGFVAGAAVVGLVHRRRRRRSLVPRRANRRRPARGGPVGELVQIVGTRSLLVDVHLLGGRD